jgi:hypothetical protein
MTHGTFCLFIGIFDSSPIFSPAADFLLFSLPPTTPPTTPPIVPPIQPPIGPCHGSHCPPIHPSIFYQIHPKLCPHPTHNTHTVVVHKTVTQTQISAVPVVFVPGVGFVSPFNCKLSASGDKIGCQFTEVNIQ